MQNHETYLYVGLAGEGDNIAEGGLYRKIDGDEEWHSIANGLPENPQVRSLLVHPEDPSVVYAGTNLGPYRSDDYGQRWEALEAPRPGMDVWSLAFHPHDSRIMYAGYEPCQVYRSEDAGENWQRMNTDGVVFPHITTVMPPFGKRVIGMAIDPSNPQDMYGAIEVGGLLASRDGGESWESVMDGPHTHIHTLDLHGVQVSAASPGTVFAISRVGMFRSRDRGLHWELVNIEEQFPGGSYCRGILVAPDDPRTMYLATGSGGGGSPAGTPDSGVLFRSRDVGETWEQVDLGETPPNRMFEIAVDRADPSRVYCVNWGGWVYTSHDGGNSWSRSQVPFEANRSRHVYTMACG